ncbi:MAG: DUF421 domain-containing protein [Symbiobacterium thermophilum]|uniref:YetF C-terminal domain-containing protein n=2 Tax=Symbiobacterium thermophilum TaxID=2734 RepID=Q67QE5_SYMTH|nr:DUF421 domain-containing protein [Symbiobacterium thermophilum]BAD40098.1 conserved hypothetical protein [Symbiobacterium thermophilum IAM 14863]
MWILAQIFTSDWAKELIQHVPVLLMRTVLTFILVMIVVRWTGKRSIANLAPFDLAMMIMIGEVAAIPIGELDVDFLHGLIPVALLGGLHVALTTVNLHWKSFERWTEGFPTLLVKDGRVLRRNLLKERVSMADLMTALRHKEVEDVSEVKEAWMEQAGGISVILKREAGPATPRDVELVVERVLARRLPGVVQEAVERAVRDAIAAAGKPSAEAHARPRQPDGRRWYREGDDVLH